MAREEVVVAPPHCFFRRTGLRSPAHALRRTGMARYVLPTAWSTRAQARQARAGNRRRGMRLSERLERRWTAQAANNSHLLDSRQPSLTEVRLSLCGRDYRVISRRSLLVMLGGAPFVP